MKVNRFTTAHDDVALELGRHILVCGDVKTGVILAWIKLRVDRGEERCCFQWEWSTVTTHHGFVFVSRWTGKVASNKSSAQIIRFRPSGDSDVRQDDFQDHRSKIQHLGLI